MKNSEKKVGVLLVNLGTPKATTPKAVKLFLSEFLQDKRVVDKNPFLWYPLLHGVILPFRASKIARLYKNIWMVQGSPLLVYSIRQKLELERATGLPVEIGMTYGHPSMSGAVKSLLAQGVNKIVVLPLYPQYSQTTTAAAFDKFALTLKEHPVIPEFHFVHHYYDNDDYIEALAISIEAHWKKKGKPDMLLCSYHGIPVRYSNNGDLYLTHCTETTAKLRQRLRKDVPIRMTFQSRFGPEPWLEPYTDKTITSLPKEGIKHLDVITPGFSVDCLETVEEISVLCRSLFLKAGGDIFEYIPCLNDAPQHIEMMRKLVETYLKNV